MKQSDRNLAHKSKFSPVSRRQARHSQATDQRTSGASQVSDIRTLLPENRDEDSSSYSDRGSMAEQEHARPRHKIRLDISGSSISDTASLSNTSLTTSISRFRTDFEELKCKMQIFGESLNLCKCIASDFKNKLTLMEKRLESLEKRERLARSESNYSAIIKKNKRLSNKTQQDAKVSLVRASSRYRNERATSTIVGAVGAVGMLIILIGLDVDKKPTLKPF